MPSLDHRTVEGGPNGRGVVVTPRPQRQPGAYRKVGLLLGGEATGGQGGCDEQRHPPIIEPTAFG